AGISTDVCNHSFRATGITAYLENPEARVEVAQYLAGHADPKTTKLYDQRADRISLDEIERIGI
ncbi:MAG: integrase, partial [Chloroflexi bacterium]|nr:integrase [Chloroflexota bacterium]